MILELLSISVGVEEFVPSKSSNKFFREIRMCKKKLINKSGFTLIEIMIVLVIISLLVAIAMPSYSRYVMRSRRVEARDMLQSAAQRLHAAHSANLTYVVAGQTLADWGLDGNKYYEIKYSDDKGAPTANTFILEAKARGGQEADKCKTFTLDQSGVKKANGEGARARISLECWRE